MQLDTSYYRAYKARILRLSAEGGWIVFGEVTKVMGSLVLVRVLTEYLDPEQYGQLALAVTVAGLINQTVLGGIANGVSRFYSIAAEKHGVDAYLLATRYLLAYATTVVAAIGFMLVTCLHWLGLSKWGGLAAAALVFSLLSGYNSVLDGIQNAARQRRVVAFHGGLHAWLNILLALGTMLWFGASSTTIVIGYACSSLLTTLSQLFFLRRTIPKKRTPIQNYEHWVSQIWAYSMPFSVWGIFTWLQQVSDRWALQAFATSSDVGQYAVLFQLGYSPILLLTGVAMSFLGPILYQQSGDVTDPVRNANVHRMGWRLSQISVMIALLAFAITSGFHKQFFGLLVASQYQGSSHLLPWVVLAGGLFAAGQMLALKMMSEMKVSNMAIAKIATALIGVLFNIFGALLAGVQGVVGALLTFSVIYFVWMAMLGRRVLQNNTGG